MITTKHGNELIFGNVNICFGKCNENMVKLVYKHIPVIIQRISKKPAPWLTLNIRQLQQ